MPYSSERVWYLGETHHPYLQGRSVSWRYAPPKYWALFKLHGGTTLKTILFNRQSHSQAFKSMYGLFVELVVRLCISHSRFEILTAVTMRITIFQDAMPFTPANIPQHFRETSVNYQTALWYIPADSNLHIAYNQHLDYETMDYTTSSAWNKWTNKVTVKVNLSL
jgi:hypothetical protein